MIIHDLRQNLKNKILVQTWTATQIQDYNFILLSIFDWLKKYYIYYYFWVNFVYRIDSAYFLKQKKCWTIPP